MAAQSESKPVSEKKNSLVSFVDNARKQTYYKLAHSMAQTNSQSKTTWPEIP
jgi:hypothetical protein